LGAGRRGGHQLGQRRERRERRGAQGHPKVFFITGFWRGGKFVVFNDMYRIVYWLLVSFVLSLSFP